MNDVVRLDRPRAKYGPDGDYRLIPAPVLGVAYVLACLSAFVFAVAAFGDGGMVTGAVLGGIALSLLWLGFFAIYATRVGKFAVWARILTRLRLRGDERLLDLGCGRGAVLLVAGKPLPNGTAVVDLWRADQSGNSAAAPVTTSPLRESATGSKCAPAVSPPCRWRIAASPSSCPA